MLDLLVEKKFNIRQDYICEDANFLDRLGLLYIEKKRKNLIIPEYSTLICLWFFRQAAKV
jgi:hypothetical protein